MVITICGSMCFYSQMIKYKRELKRYGHYAIYPKLINPKKQLLKIKNNCYIDNYKYKIKFNLIRKHFQKIQKSDAILVVNL